LCFVCPARVSTVHSSLPTPLPVFFQFGDLSLTPEDQITEKAYFKAKRSNDRTSTNGKSDLPGKG
jgi:hypothetical protein